MKSDGEPSLRWVSVDIAPHFAVLFILTCRRPRRFEDPRSEEFAVIFWDTPKLDWAFHGPIELEKQKFRQVKNSIEREVRLHKYTPFNHSMVSFKSQKYDWIGMRMDGFWSEGSFSEAEDWRFLLSSWPGSQMHNIHWKALRCYMSPTQHETHSFVC